ncbi:MAG: isopentenyl-diphosphate delta-isomerase [Hyphomonadaceae bacterium]|nr:isopentenyl-diphosphate delta-isomerase [Hyphomonadaceae bacterium]
MRTQSLRYRRMMVLEALAGRSAQARRVQIIPGIDKDGALYPIEKMKAHRVGALHLAVSVFVMSGDALLLQQRAAGKYHCGGLWANTCCSHPSWGETPADSAHRRLREELGLSIGLSACNVLDYAADVTNGLREHERVHIFRGEVERSALQLDLDPDEVSAVRWMTLRELQQARRASPEGFAPWFRIYLDRWDELGLS